MFTFLSIVIDNADRAADVVKMDDKAGAQALIVGMAIGAVFFVVVLSLLCLVLHVQKQKKEDAE